MGSLDLDHRGFEIPPRQQRHAEHALPGFFLKFSKGVVVDLHANQAQHVVRRLQKVLVSEAGDVWIHDLGVNAELVHHLDPGFGIEAGPVDHLVVHVEECGAGDLFASGVDD